MSPVFGSKGENMEEQWKDIEGYEGLYQVSNLGRIKSLPRLKRNRQSEYYTKERIRNQSSIYTGYMKITLHDDTTRRTYFVHRLVAKAFVENPNNLPEINHIDENKKNNRADNLEWCSRKYNMNYGEAAEKRKEKCKMLVVQCDKEGNVIKMWKGQKEAAKALKISNTTISRCCNGHVRTAGGYIWKNAEPNLN